ncbi:MAG: hypothetical protein A3H93_18430 [Rhodocyclales bacterium RIFCSPLOWO2_02_FULL_63_24]|nr:MAG: hypothetical protein A2040_06295 [Rhodocyclales bacterium GWA2_65_19]OHC71021.1 MAG: hypothetical protein A3H93_18430 [Rhodocyclales bacterium RIFCSPLOWO2_02_FULL_63_24]
MKSPSPGAAATPGTPEHVKPQKPRRASGRCKISDYEYRQLVALKKRLLALGMDVKKSQLLRAGLMLLVVMDDVQLSQSVAKTGFSAADGLPINAI